MRAACALPSVVSAAGVEQGGDGADDGVRQVDRILRRDRVQRLAEVVELMKVVSPESLCDSCAPSGGGRR